MPISFSIPTALNVGGTLTVSSLTNALLRVDGSGVVSSVTIGTNFSLSGATFSLASTLTAVNSITSTAGQNLTLAAGTAATGLIQVTATSDATDATGGTGGLGVLGGISVAKSGRFGIAVYVPTITLARTTTIAGTSTVSRTLALTNTIATTGTNPVITAIYGVNNVTASQAGATVYGLYTDATYAGTPAATSVIGASHNCTFSGLGGIAGMYGTKTDITVFQSGASGTVTEVIGHNINISNGSAGAAAVTTNYGMKIAASAGTWAVTNYGLHIGNIEAGTTAYSIYTGTGPVRFGDATDSSGADGLSGAVRTLGGLSVKLSGRFGGDLWAERGVTSVSTTAGDGITSQTTSKTIDSGLGGYDFGLRGILSLTADATTADSLSRGVYGRAVLTATSSPVQHSISGGTFSAEYNGTSNPADLYGVTGYAYMKGRAGGNVYGGKMEVLLGSTSGTVASITGLNVTTTGNIFTSAVVTNVYGVNVEPGSFTALVGGGTATNYYGLKIGDVSGATALNYSIYTGTGIVRFGDTSDATTADGTTGAVRSLGGASFAQKVFSGTGFVSSSLFAGTATNLILSTSSGYHINASGAKLMDARIGLGFTYGQAQDPDVGVVQIKGSTGANTFPIGFYTDVTISVDATGYYGYAHAVQTAASAALPSLIHYSAFSLTKGSGSTVTTQTGFEAAAGLIGATNNYGFRGSIPSGTGRYNLYMDGTAANYLAGVLTVSASTATPAGGSTAARLLFGTTAGFGIYYGSGTPSVSAAQGSIYLRSDGSSTTTRLYVNTDGSTTWKYLTAEA
jgi:hypothetical protein